MSFQILCQSIHQIGGNGPLHAILPGIARPTDKDFTTPIGQVLGGVVAHVRKIGVGNVLAKGNCVGALNGHHGRFERFIYKPNFCFGKGRKYQRPDFLPIGGIHHQCPMIPQMVNQNIVACATLFVQNQSILHLTLNHGSDRTGDKMGQMRLGPWTIQTKPAHVGNVKGPYRGPNRKMFFDDAFVLDRHLPAGKIHHAPA